MSKLISVEDFGEKYEQDPNYIYVMRYNGVIPDEVLVKKSSRRSLVDESYFVRRKEFKKRIWNESHDNFYFLTKHLASFQLALLLHKVDPLVSRDTWNSFISVTLFSFGNDSIFSYKPSMLQWKFWRYSRWLIRAAFVLVDVKPINRDIDVLLEGIRRKWSIKAGDYVEVAC